MGVCVFVCCCCWFVCLYVFLIHLFFIIFFLQVLFYGMVYVVHHMYTVCTALCATFSFGTNRIMYVSVCNELYQKRKRPEIV